MRRRLGIALQLALLALVAWAVWRRLAPELAGTSLRDFVRWRPAVGLLALATLGLTALHLVQAFLWRRVLVDVGAPPPDARTTVRVYFMSGLARFIPGMVWQFPAFAVLGQQAGIPPLASSASGVIGNLAFLATGIVFLAFTLPGAPGAVELLVGVLAAAGALAGVFVFTATPAGARVRAWAVRRAPAQLKPAVELAARIRPAHALAWTLGYAGSWILLAASYAVFVEAFVPGTIGHFRQLGGIMAASYLGGLLVPFAPAGLGVREGIMVRLLAGVVPAPAAVIIPVAQRLWFFLAEFLALASFPLFPHRHDGANGANGATGTNGADATRSPRARDDRKLREVL